MKRFLTALLCMAMLLSIAACAAPIVETAPSEEATPTMSEAVTQSPTIEPTPTPEPTPEPLTEGQQMYFDWLELRDIYGACKAMIAYKNGELDSFIREGIIDEENIEELTNHYEFAEILQIEDDFISGTYGNRVLSGSEFIIGIFRGDNNIKCRNQGSDPVSEINEDLMSFFNNGESFILALPEESREKITRITAMFKDIRGKDITEFEQLIRGSSLSWKERWYVYSVLTSYLYIERDDISGFLQFPKVIYNGEEMFFGEYMVESGLGRELITGLEGELSLDEAINEVYQNCREN